jgi:DNA-binding MarR family transcriptional regulator
MDTLPQSSQIVLMVLGTKGAMTHKDLVRESRCKPRTVRYALKKLKEQGLLVSKMNRQDMRQIIYEFRIIPAPEAAIARK